jgi:hypothetical protein
MLANGAPEDRVRLHEHEIWPGGGWQLYLLYQLLLQVACVVKSDSLRGAMSWQGRRRFDPVDDCRWVRIPCTGIPGLPGCNHRLSLGARVVVLLYRLLTAQSISAPLQFEEAGRLALASFKAERYEEGSGSKGCRFCFPIGTLEVPCMTHKMEGPLHSRAGCRVLRRGKAPAPAQWNLVLHQLLSKQRRGPQSGVSSSISRSLALDPLILSQLSGHSHH